MLNFTDPHALLKRLHDDGDASVATQIDTFARTLGEEQFCRFAASQLVKLARPEQAVPAGLTHFAPLIYDGIEFFLARINSRRLTSAIVAQVRLDPAAGAGERLLVLAYEFPTLHKLAQIIARHPGLDLAVKTWLIPLETGVARSDPEPVKATIKKLADQSGYDCAFSEEIMDIAEASVAQVIPVVLSKRNCSERFIGVAKILKPGVAQQLREELAIMAEAADHFSSRRAQYGLRSLELGSLFAEVRVDLIREIDLRAEQGNLDEAVRLYENVAGVEVPRRYTLCNDSVTTMSFVAGGKLPDLTLPDSARQMVARQVFAAIICTPLFAREDVALFHGDPHAGNIVARYDEAAGQTCIGLLDWTLAGRLDRRTRLHLMDLLCGVAARDGGRIGRVVGELARESISTAKIKDHLRSLLHDESFGLMGPLTRGFHILEQLSMEGVVFTSELILFRKSFFTLEGVLADLSPGFDMDAAMASYLGELLVREAGYRMTTALMPGFDVASLYPSMLSNRDLAGLSWVQLVEHWQRTAQVSWSLVDVYHRAVAAFFGMSDVGR
jgi:ubiquinone biosynthesis protein